MSGAAGRLARTRAALAAVVVARAALWGFVAAAACAVAVLCARRLWWLPSPDDGLAALVAAVIGVGAALILGTIGVRGLGRESVALWVETRVPRLGYALVTAAERRGASPLDAALERQVAGVDWRRPAARAAARALALPLAALAVLAAAAAGVRRIPEPPRATTLRLAGRAPAGRGAAAPGALASLGATVTPPAYAGRPARELREPAAVRELVGSRVELHGPTAGAGLRARIGSRPLAVAPRGDRWRVTVAMPARPAAITLADGRRTRIVVLEPQPDSAPVVQLAAPARDSVFRAPAGRVPLAATATDDVGLARGGFEYIVSSGSGESFTFRSGRIGERALAGASARLAGVVDLAALALKAGDVIHVRAVAGDGNRLSGPATGASETRTLRVARAGEYDSLVVEAAGPPAVDSSLVSQRMLITLTEALVRRRPRLAREEVVRESRRIGADQARLRRAASDVVFTRLGAQPTGEHSHFEGDGHEHGAGEVRGPLTPEALLEAASRATGGGTPGALDTHDDETPVVAVNRPLLEAYNAMWDAGRELDAAEPARALPPMRLALAAIQRARHAERVYLRGRPPAVVVDVARVRLQGAERGASSVRAPRPPADDPGAALGARLTSALALLERAPAAAVDSITLLRVEALGAAPALADALGEAVARLQDGRDATAALVRARRLTSLAGGGAEPLGLWGAP